MTVTGTTRGAASASASAPGSASTRSDGIDEEGLLELDESVAGCVAERARGSANGRWSGHLGWAGRGGAEVGGRHGCGTGIERFDLLPLLGVLALLLLTGRREAVEQCVHLVYREDHWSTVGPGCACGLWS